MGFILKRLAIVTLPSQTGARWVSRLSDKVGNDTMEDDAIVVSYERTKVMKSAWNKRFGDVV